MTETRASLAAACAAVMVLLGACGSPAPEFLAEHPSIDLLIENGQVVDGSGSAPRAADVVVVDDQIVFVGEAQFSEAALAERVKRRIDADGRVVAPGFIDLHSHGDPLETPRDGKFPGHGCHDDYARAGRFEPGHAGPCSVARGGRRKGDWHQPGHVCRSWHAAYIVRHRSQRSAGTGRYGAHAHHAGRHP